MCPGATEFTRMPRGPSSVARLCAIASIAALATLYGPMVRWENRTTIEFTITTEPPEAASAGMNRRVIRRAEITLLLKPACTASRSAAPRSAMGGITSALCTSASTLPNSPTAAAASRSASASIVMSVGTTSARRPSSLISAATSSSRDAVLAASTTSAPAAAPRTAICRPRSGPTPDTTSTLSCRYISGLPCCCAGPWSPARSLSPASGSRPRPAAPLSGPGTAPG